MTEWNIVQGKFSPQEYVHIKKFMKLHSIRNDNQLVRRAIEDLIGLSVADTTRRTQVLPPEYIAVYNFYTQYCKKLGKTPRKQKAFKEFFKEWSIKYLSRQSRKEFEKLSRANKMWSDFRKHGKVGRPKKSNSRGRPKDTGLD